ncbi:MAG: radical SAM protein [Verrucomicrobia bacterium]|nr:radical SAM protein [Verrucomicrobiota bacterium]
MHQPRFPLRLVFWETTARCNLYCIHCRASVSHRPLPGELTTKEALRFIRSLAAFAAPILVLSGGEPLLRADIYTLAAEASRLGLRVALATNGTLVDDAAARRCKAAGIVRAGISLDGPDAPIHDAFRGLEGSFDAAISGLTRLQAAGIETQINTTVASHNVDALPRTLDLALQLGVKALHLFLLVPVGCGAEIAAEQMISPERYEQVLEWLVGESSRLRGRIELKATCAPHYFRVSRQRASTRQQGRELGAEIPHGHGMSPDGMSPDGMSADGMSAVTKGCLAGQHICFISHTGEVYPCGYLPISSGNICTTPLETIWDISEVFAKLRDPGLLEGKCGICGFRTVCGGCRARAYALTGDYLAEEPFCVYQPPRLGKPTTGTT